MCKRHALVPLALAVVLFAVRSADADSGNMNYLLKGDYAFSGMATCLNSAAGFNQDLTPAAFPAPFPTVSSFSIQGVRTFHGDGTGTVVARSVSIGHPFALPTSPTPVFNRGGAGASDIEAAFTYQVAADRTFTIVTPLVNGTNVLGPFAGQTFTITNLPVFSGAISEDRRTLTVHHDEPSVETVTPSFGNPTHRVCARTRILLELK